MEQQNRRNLQDLPFIAWRVGIGVRITDELDVMTGLYGHILIRRHSNSRLEEDLKAGHSNSCSGGSSR